MSRWIRGAVLLAVLAGSVVLIRATVHVPSYVFPSAHALYGAFTQNGNLLWHAAATTGEEAALGFALGNGAAIVAALLVGGSGGGGRSVLALATLLRSIPIIALTPILSLWLGIGTTSKVVVVALIVFFPTLVICARGLAAYDRDAFAYLRVLHASRLQILTKLELPSSIPYLFAALKAAAPTAVFGAVVAEWLYAREGVGHVIAVATYEFRSELLWAGAIVSALLGLGFFVAVALVERVVAPWSVGGDI